MLKQDTSNTAQAFWIGIGSLCSFLFSVVSSAILSRYLTKADYGTYKQVMYVYNTLLSVFTLGLPLAYSYFLPRVSLAEGKTLSNKLNGVFLILGSIFAIVLFSFANVFADILKNQDLGHNIRIFSSAPIFILPTMGLQGILATYKQTVWNAIYVVTTRIFMLCFVALPVAFYKANCETAIWGFIISSAISCGVALWIKNIPFKGIKKIRCSITYKQIFQYSIPLMAAGFLGIGIKAADQFFVSRYYGQEVFADFANGSLELPFVGMILSAGATVLLPEFSRMISSGKSSTSIVDLWKRTAVKSAYIIYPLVTFFWFFADYTMTFLYGDKYSSSAVYFRIMLLVNFFTVIPYYPIILALGKTRTYANIHIVNFVLVWVFEFIAVVVSDSAIIISIISVLCHLVKIFLMMNLVSRSIQISIFRLFPLKELLKIFISCVVAGGLVWHIMFFMPFVDVKWVVLFVGFVFYSIFILLIGKLFNINYIDLIIPFVNKVCKK